MFRVTNLNLSRWVGTTLGTEGVARLMYASHLLGA